ncbi:MAG: hypothetical protein WDN49_10620 [Acetobacteraceae bacterium]
MPIAIKAVTTMIKKARRMAAEFQTHVDDMVKDADLSEVRDQFRDLRSMDIRGAITRAVDGDGTIREAFKDPIRSPPPTVTSVSDVSTTAPMTEVAVEPSATHTIDQASAESSAPAFIPPASVPEPPPPPPAAPAFIPPEAARPAHDA